MIVKLTNLPIKQFSESLIYLNSHLLPLFISYGSSGEKLIKFQANSTFVIISVILMTTLFFKALVLQGEIWCWSLLRLEGLIPYFPHYLPAAVHALVPNLPLNSRTWKWDKCTTVGEENRIIQLLRCRKIFATAFSITTFVEKLFCGRCGLVCKSKCSFQDLVHCGVWIGQLLQTFRGWWHHLRTFTSVTSRGFV